jgi:hypothetical protein
VLIWVFESAQKGGNIHGFGDAAFFCSVQLLTVSSSMTNPLTTVGKIVDVGLEAWAIFVVTAVAGSFATFFSSGDASLSASLRPVREGVCGHSGGVGRSGAAGRSSLMPITRATRSRWTSQASSEASCRRATAAIMQSTRPRGVTPACRHRR